MKTYREKQHNPKAKTQHKIVNNQLAIFVPPHHNRDPKQPWLTRAESALLKLIRPKR